MLRRFGIDLPRIRYFLKTGYLVDGERVIPDFPDENVQNHLKVYKFLEQFVAGADVLDIGCGTGYGTAHLAPAACSIVGVDISKPALRWARKHYPGIRYLAMDAQHLGFPDNSFDVIVSSENFEHLHDQPAHVAELARVLRPQGLCFVASPNPEMFVGTHNPFHTKENTFDELTALFHQQFGNISILENSAAPPTPTGEQQREQRWLNGHRGTPLPTGIDPTWLHNTHSFFCFARAPKKP